MMKVKAAEGVHMTSMRCFTLGSLSRRGIIGACASNGGCPTSKHTKGFSTMVVEASPEIANFVFSTLGKPDRLARMAARP